MLASAQREAEETLRNHEVLALSAQAQVALAEALLNPPAPNEALKQMFADYEAQAYETDI